MSLSHQQESGNAISVYFMPGLAAGSSIFENIELPENEFRVNFLEWFVPERGMSLESYALKMCEQVEGDNPVLVGVSFGGVLVQEMARHLSCRKVVIVSSVKELKEMPKRLMLARYTKLHKILPTSLVGNLDMLARYAFGETAINRIELYKRYLSVRDPYYLDWAIDQMVNWQPREVPCNLVHIHGDNDSVFPYQHIGPCICVEGGTHTMILHRFRWFNENLPAILLNEDSYTTKAPIS